MKDPVQSVVRGLNLLEIVAEHNVISLRRNSHDYEANRRYSSSNWYGLHQSPHAQQPDSHTLSTLLEVVNLTKS